MAGSGGGAAWNAVVDPVGQRDRLDVPILKGDGELPGARVESQLSTALVGFVTVETAQREQVPQVGEPVLLPFEEVVDVAKIEVRIESPSSTTGMMLASHA
jgi:hypothetical protein